MEYRRTSVVLNRQQQIGTVSSYIPAYSTFAGGPARLGNGLLFETTTMWWDEEKIASTVTRQFVLSKLRPDEQLRLDQTLGFGDGLTDDTYMERIEDKAKRMFLTLVDLGVPDQIFGVIDDSWDDDDLPIPLDQVVRLKLTYDRDEKLEKKFFQRQFQYLLRNIQKGDHIDYDDDEVVPLELIEKRPVVVGVPFTHTNVDKIHLPGRPNDVFIRKRIPLGITPGRMPPEEFLAGITSMKTIEHDHLSSLWASYTHENFGYVIFTPVADTNLRSILTVTPQFIKILPKQDRRVLLMNWIHCLADAISFLHSHRQPHKNIRPSNVMVDFNNHIFLGDVGIISMTNIDGEKTGFDKEVYDYSAPEIALQPQLSATNSLPLPRTSTATARRSTVRSTATYSTSIYSANTSASAPNDNASILTSSTNSARSDSPRRGHSRSHSGISPRIDPLKADIFALGTTFIEILSFLLKRSSRTFASARERKNKTPGRGGAVPDSSYHKNLSQVFTWIDSLAKDASKKEDRVFSGVGPILDLCKEMLSLNPEARPDAKEVQERMYVILNEKCGLGPLLSPGSREEARGRIHCESRKTEESVADFGYDQARLASQRAAAEACANVKAGAMGSLGVNGGVIKGVVYERPSRMASIYPERIRERMQRRSGEGGGDGVSVVTKTSRSSGKRASVEGSQQGTTVVGKLKPKAKAWQAPVYAGEYSCLHIERIVLIMRCRDEFRLITFPTRSRWIHGMGVIGIRIWIGK